MKSTRLFLAALAAGAVLPAAGLLAQTTAAAPAVPASTPSVSAPASTAKVGAEEEEGGGRMMARYKALTPEEQAKLRAANKMARQDPAFIAVQGERKTNPKAFREARRAAMLKADPTIAPILEKMKEEHRAMRKGV